MKDYVIETNLFEHVIGFNLRFLSLCFFAHCVLFEFNSSTERKNVPAIKKYGLILEKITNQNFDSKTDREQRLLLSKCNAFLNGILKPTVIHE